ncbi:HK97 family phage prohead protease [Paracoccus endophyticus]|uniref:HK97 family phage prohead protease n=1 Tax=Paracoccus endophyticus TaxID=2233774 RepID=UPI000DDA9A71|nr:HK97 family phage prohead protease [Paracoccus endophyticus]
MMPLEIRAATGGSSILTARFPYGDRATISDGGKSGRPRKEQFRPGAFTHSINSPNQEINLLVGHDFSRPLASKNAGTLQVDDRKDALIIEAEMLPAMKQTSHWQDFFAGYSSGLITGISPGFRIPPPSAVPVAEIFEEEPPSLGRAIIRTILAAILFEFSLVTRPAYRKTSVSIRDYVPPSEVSPDDAANDPYAMPSQFRNPQNRWR